MPGKVQNRLRTNRLCDQLGLVIVEESLQYFGFGPIEARKLALLAFRDGGFRSGAVNETSVEQLFVTKCHPKPMPSANFLHSAPEAICNLKT